MNVLEIKSLITCIAVLTIIFSGIFTVQDAYVDHDNLPFSSNDQTICYHLLELDDVTIDGNSFQSGDIRDLTNLAAQYISDNTNMNIHDEPCDTLETNIIRSFNFRVTFLDGYVEAYPEHSTPSYKYILYNTFLGHPYLSNGTCEDRPFNLQYIANHEFGHCRTRSYCR